MLVNTEITPNPDTLKFLPGKKVSEVGPIEFLKSDKNIKVSLASKIFEVSLFQYLPINPIKNLQHTKFF